MLYACLVRDLKKLSLEAKGVKEVKRKSRLEICVCSFPVDRGGLVMMDDVVNEVEGATTNQGRGVQWCR